MLIGTAGLLTTSDLLTKGTGMNIVYLNGQYMPMQEAKISPMDRGFLFGDGVYEVIPSYLGKALGFDLHLARLNRNLKETDIQLGLEHKDWRTILDTLLERNNGENVGVYLQVSRGADTKRLHAYPKGIAPTVFAFSFDIAAQKLADKSTITGLKVSTEQDQRWSRCHIKSTSLLGNLMHYQHGQSAGVNETILYNSDNQLTEASACNVFVVKNGVLITPPLDHQLLGGITRHILLDIIRKEGLLEVQERIIDMSEVRQADEIWLTSSSKEIAPVIELDKQAVGDGQVGDIWQSVQATFNRHKFDY